MFPARIPGVALLILRLCIAGLVVLSSTTLGRSTPLPVRVTVVSIVVSLLCLGLFTPVICFASALLQAIALSGADASMIFGVGVHVAMTVCLLLLGPGAYSVDARRYGRRLILPRAY